MATISVIVPVYNAEKYLSRCVDSILKQTFSDFEIILVDDGSPDNSGKICDEYALKDKRVKVTHQENQGVSAARQKGLDIATGEYVIHADPDDWVERDWLESLYDKALTSKADMSICDFRRYYRTCTIDYRQEPTSLDNNSIIIDLMTGRLWGSMWNKLVKRDSIIRYGVCFHKKMSLWEDLYFCCELLSHDIKVTYVNKTLYNYDSIINENSIVQYKKMSHLSSEIAFIEDMRNLFCTNTLVSDAIYYKEKESICRWFDTCKYSAIDITPQMLYHENSLKRYCKEANFSLNDIKPFCIYLCIKGITPIGRMVYDMDCAISHLKSRIKHIIKCN